MPAETRARQVCRGPPTEYLLIGTIDWPGAEEGAFGALMQERPWPSLAQPVRCAR